MSNRMTVADAIATVKDLQTTADFAATGDMDWDKDFDDLAKWLQALVDNGHLKDNVSYADTKLAN